MGITERIDAITHLPDNRCGTIIPAPRSVKIELTGRCNFNCLRGDTPVDTIYGPIPIRDLAENFDTVPVYTYKDGEVIISDAIGIRRYGDNDELVRVHFDDGTHIDCTPDHKFLVFKTRGSARGSAAGCDEWAEEAQNLKPGDRLRAFRENRNLLVTDYLAGRRLERHKVAAVEWLPEREATYCLTVPETGWFFANKVLVKNCMFCARGDGLREQKDMDRAFFSRIIREMRAAGVEELGLFYLGESMLCSWLADAVAEAKAVGFPYVFLTTNGSLATRTKVESLFRAGLDSLKFSFNYADEAQFARVTQVKAGLYHKVRQNVHAARLARDEVEAETGHRCGLYASYIQYDGEQAERMEATADWLRQFVDEVYALPLYNQAGFCKEKLKADAEEWAQTAGNMGRVGALVPPLPCWALFAEGHISWNGALTGCCFSHTPDFDFGDLNEVSFAEAWNSAAAQALRAASLRKDVRGTACEHCVAYQS